MKTFPFRYEADLLSADNIAKSYFVECKIRGLIKSSEDVEAHLETYAKRNLVASKQRQQLLNKILTKCPLETSTFEPLQRPALAESCLPGADLPSRILPECTLAPLESFTLTSDQRVVVDQIIAAPSGLHIVSGAPGSAKHISLSTFIRFTEARESPSFFVHQRVLLQFDSVGGRPQFTSAAGSRFVPPTSLLSILEVSTTIFCSQPQ